MKQRTLFLCFILLCFAVCIFPAALMAGFASKEPIGNETLASFPQLTKDDGTVNTDLLSQMGDYFERHYAFRPQLITADAAVQTSLFDVSNTDSVVTGTDGWLFYSSTLDDYLGKSQLTARGIFNLAHNLALAQAYVTAQGAQFLFLVPPNKNSLYPEHMPYYYQPDTEILRNRDRLSAALEEADVSYLDLFELLSMQEETLYLKQDSHWNNKGAALVCDTALSVLGKEHQSYDDGQAAYEAVHRGDLAEMIYPASAGLEYDYTYEQNSSYTYLPNAASSDPVSVEDFRIETLNSEAEGSLLMYRDSFGNTLLPFMADAFSHGYFSKAVPYAIARDMQQYQPDTVILELVERNIRNLAVNPPLVPCPRTSLTPETLQLIPDAQTTVKNCDADITFIEFSGVLPESRAEEKERIYLEITIPGGNTAMYEAFTVTVDDNDFGYRVYLPQSVFGGLEMAQQSQVRVFAG